MVIIPRTRKKRRNRYITFVIPLTLIIVAIFIFKDIIMTDKVKQPPQEESNIDANPPTESEVPDVIPPITEPDINIEPDTTTYPDTNTEPDTTTEPEIITEPDTETEPLPQLPDYNSIWSLILVNQSHLLPDNFSIETEKVQGKYEMDERAAEFAKQMIAAAKTDGVDLLLCSAYRSLEKQQQLYNDQIQKQKDTGLDEQEAIAVAGTIVAKPGTSEHHTGLALDIVTPEYQNLNSGYAKTDASKWLVAHAHEYGFILHFPEDKQDITKIIYEPWHYRYVGTEYSYEIKEKGLCFEEFLGLTD